MDFRLNKHLFLGLFGVLCLLLPSAAKADSFDWTYQGTFLLSGVLSSGGGELSTTDGVITELSGTFNGLAITALLPPGAAFGNDNLLQIPPAPLFVTPGGFSFLDSAGDVINIYAALGVPFNMYASVSFDGNADIGNFTLAPVVVSPEPGTATMLLSAILLFGLFLQRKRLGTGTVPQS
jgi:hypothetical protein